MLIRKIFVLTLMLLLIVPLAVLAQDDMTDEMMMEIESADIDVTSGDMAYASYLAAPAEGGPYPGIVLIHSFRGMEEGYRTMVDHMAAEGFVVLGIGWQTFEQSPSDNVMEQLMLDSIDFLTARDDVDPERIGLTGFCAGGRYTMLFMPQVEAFGAGVAWYGFPNNGEPSPADLLGDLESPMLIIHGTEDQPSPITGIYEYATALGSAGKDFELKVYAGEPHGFMLSGGQLRTDDVAMDAYNEMMDYFRRKLG